MPDLHARFRHLDRVHAPDLWSEAVARAALAGTAPRAWVPSLSRPVRIGLVLFALLIASIGFAVLGGLLRETDPPSSELPANGWVAYMRPEGSFRSSPTDIYMVREGAAPRLVIGDEAYDEIRQTCPAFSPDGTRLAYAESRTVVVVGIDETGMPSGPEVRFPVRGDVDPCPQWSPNGLQIAVPGIQIFGLDGSSKAIDGSGTQGLSWVGHFAWSPDGTALAVIRGSNLWIAPVDGGNPRLVYAGGATELASPAWSPDGSRIAIAADFSSQPTPSPEGEIAGREEEWMLQVVRADGTGTPVQLGRGGAPAWSPEGDRIAFLAGADPEMEGVGELVVTDADGGDRYAVPAVPVAGASRAWDMHAPIWSPDGERLLVIGSKGAGYYGSSLGWGESVLISVSATGDSPPLVLTEPWFQEYYSSPLSWQPLFRSSFP